MLFDECKLQTLQSGNGIVALVLAYGTKLSFFTFSPSAWESLVGRARARLHLQSLPDTCDHLMEMVTAHKRQ